MLQQLLPALRMTVLLTVLTGILYPAVVTGLCQALFSRQANGSLVRNGDTVVGSALIGQNFAQPRYFHPRPSAAGADGYDATASSGSNLAPTNKKLFDTVAAAVQQYRKANGDYAGPIPADAVTASGSGLDPEISVANAGIQAGRVAQARHRPEADIRNLVASSVEGRFLGIFGEPRINVLELNRRLDQ